MTGTVLPTSCRLIAAMEGDVPFEHPAVVILRAAFLLATVDYWIDPDTAATSTCETGTVLLWEMGIDDVSALVRARLIDDINHAVSSREIGAAVDAVARAWFEYRRCARYRGDSRFDDVLYHRAVVTLTRARARYTRLRRSIKRRETTPNHAAQHRIFP